MERLPLPTIPRVTCRHFWRQRMALKCTKCIVKQQNLHIAIRDSIWAKMKQEKLIVVKNKE